MAWVPKLLDGATHGDTSRLGRDLAPLGIRYVVVVGALAPKPFGGRDAAAAPGLAVMLGEQLDLAEVKVNPAMRVFRNDSWLPIVANLGPGTLAEDTLPARIVAATALESVGPLRYEGPVRAGDVVHLAQGTSAQWTLEVNGQTVAAQESIEGASQFVAPASGTARVSYATPNRRRLVAVGQLLVWFGVIGLAVLLARRAQRPSAELVIELDPVGLDTRRTVPAEQSQRAPVLMTAGELLATRAVAAEAGAEGDQR